MNDNVQDTHAAEGSSVSKSDFPSTQTHQAEAIPQAPGKPVDRDHTVISTRPPIYSADSGVFLAPSEIGPTLVGRNLAHFKLLNFVGGGGMGAVFKAVDTMLQRVVAVKVLSRDHGRDEETVKRFQNEAQSTARLDHENIARVYFVGEDDGWYFIVFEYIEGANLRDLVESSSPLDGQTAYSFTLQIAEALEHASKRDVVHRDIKPSNVLITDDGRAKLVDMGLARLHHVHSAQDDLTATGVTLGTFDYISPEQARDPRAADVRSDIYSLGCTLFYMLTGRPPFPEGTVLQKLLSHSSDAPPDLAEWRNDIPHEFNLILQRMLAKKPKDRYQQPSELIGDLVHIAEQYGWQIMTRGEPIFIAPTRSRFSWATTHLPWTIPVALFFFFMVFLDPIWLSSQISTMPRFDFNIEEPTPGTNDNSLPNSPSDFSNEDELEPDSVPNDTDDVDSPPSSSQDEGNDSTSAETNASAVTTLIVSSNPSIQADGQRCSTLSEAISIMNDRATIERIEIWSNDSIRLSDVVTLSQTLRSTKRQLTISAGKDFQPTLLWSNTGNRRSMFKIDNTKLSLEGIRIEMRLPSVPVVGAYQIFEAASNCHIGLANCTVTVRNSKSERGSYLDDAAVFRVVPDSQETTGASGTVITLDNCAIRGEATVVRCSKSIPLELKWKHGLLVTTERLLEFQDAATQGQRVTVLIDLANVTSITDQGLASLHQNLSGQDELDVLIRSNDSIFVSQSGGSFTTWSSKLDALPLEDVRFQIRGNRNLYSGLTNVARFFNRDESISISVENATMYRSFEQLQLDFYDFSNGASEQPPASKSEVDDFLFREIVEFDGYEQIGFDPDKLPRFQVKPTTSMSPIFRGL